MRTSALRNEDPAPGLVLMGTEVNPALHAKAEEWPAKANALEIIDQPSYDTAASYLVAIKTLRGEIAETFDPIVKKAHEAHAEALAQKRRHDQPLATAEAVIKPKVAAWEAEQERIRREKELELQAEAKRLHEEETLAAAQQAEEAGASKREVNQILKQPNLNAAPVAAPTFERKSNVVTRQEWKAEITDLKKFVRACLDGQGQASMALISANMPALNTLARGNKDKLRIPGVRAVSAPVVSVRW